MNDKHKQDKPPIFSDKCKTQSLNLSVQSSLTKPPSSHHTSPAKTVSVTLHFPESSYSTLSTSSLSTLSSSQSSMVIDETRQLVSPCPQLTGLTANKAPPPPNFSTQTQTKRILFEPGLQKDQQYR